MLVDLHALYADRLLPGREQHVNYADIRRISAIYTLVDDARKNLGPTLVMASGVGLAIACRSAEDALWVARDLAAKVDDAEQEAMREHILLHAEASKDAVVAGMKAADDIHNGKG